jgi:hypothetical protein
MTGAEQNLDKDADNPECYVDVAEVTYSDRSCVPRSHGVIWHEPRPRLAYCMLLLATAAGRSCYCFVLLSVFAFALAK